MTVTASDIDQAARITELEDEIIELETEIERLQQELHESDGYQTADTLRELEDLSSAAQAVLADGWARAEIELVTPTRHSLSYLVTLRVDATPGVVALDYRPGRRVTLSTALPDDFDRLCQHV